MGIFSWACKKGSQLLTTLIVELGRYCFLLAPQGLASSGDEFNAQTDSFFQGLSTYLLKLVDDLLIQAESMEDMERHLDETLSDAEKTWSHIFNKKNSVYPQRLCSQDSNWTLVQAL